MNKRHPEAPKDSIILHNGDPDEPPSGWVFVSSEPAQWHKRPEPELEALHAVPPKGIVGSTNGLPELDEPWPTTTSPNIWIGPKSEPGVIVCGWNEPSGVPLPNGFEEVTTCVTSWIKKT